MSLPRLLLSLWGLIASAEACWPSQPQPYMTISPLPYDPQKEGRFRDCCAASPHIPAVLHDYCSYHLLSKYFNNELAREDLPLIGSPDQPLELQREFFLYFSQGMDMVDCCRDIMVFAGDLRVRE